MKAANSNPTEAVVPLFIATEAFAHTDGGGWTAYFEWAKIPQLVEVVGLDSILCRRIVTELNDEDWNHIVCEDFRLGYFLHLDYLKRRTQHVARKNILGLYRNPVLHIETPPGPGAFRFLGYDLIEERTQISALTNCGGFPEVFQNDELNRFGLIEDFNRASEVRQRLLESYPEEAHADCELYAVWRLEE
ncbi:MAG: hypothetical protein JWM16_6407 [Verrucomicrobiales bacterium]|jgi:hypothetical protein|nr:hypothetical protein [Verrucomicrobiales bacterium]